MNISISITDDLYHEITAIASRMGISISDCAEDAFSTFADTVTKCLERAHTVPAEPTITVEDILNFVATQPVSAPIWLPDLRHEFPEATKEDFDMAVIGAAKVGEIEPGKVSLHRLTTKYKNKLQHPGHLAESEYESFVPDGHGSYYCVIARRGKNV